MLQFINANLPKLDHLLNIPGLLKEFPDATIIRWTNLPKRRYISHTISNKTENTVISSISNFRYRNGTSSNDIILSRPNNISLKD